MQSLVRQGLPIGHLLHYQEIALLFQLINSIRQIRSVFLTVIEKKDNCSALVNKYRIEEEPENIPVRIPVQKNFFHQSTRNFIGELFD